MSTIFLCILAAFISLDSSQQTALKSEGAHSSSPSEHQNSFDGTASMQCVVARAPFICAAAPFLLAKTVLCTCRHACSLVPEKPSQPTKNVMLCALWQSPLVAFLEMSQWQLYNTFNCHLPVVYRLLPPEYCLVPGSKQASLPPKTECTCPQIHQKTHVLLVVKRSRQIYIRQIKEQRAFTAPVLQTVQLAFTAGFCAIMCSRFLVGSQHSHLNVITVLLWCRGFVQRGKYSFLECVNPTLFHKLSYFATYHV